MLKNKKPAIFLASFLILLVMISVGVRLSKTDFFSSDHTVGEENYSDIGEDVEFDLDEDVPFTDRGLGGRFPGRVKRSDHLIITNSSEILNDDDAESLFTDIRKYIEGSFGLDQIGRVKWIFDDYQVEFSDHHGDHGHFIDCSIHVGAHRASGASEEVSDEVETRSFPLALKLSDSEAPFYPHLSLASELNFKLFKASTPNEEFLPIEEKDLSSAFKKYERYESQLKKRGSSKKREQRTPTEKEASIP